MISTNKTIRLPKPNIFSFSECLHFLDHGYDDCLYTIEDEAVLKPLRIDGEQGLLKVFSESKALKVELISGKMPIAKAAHYLTEWFDLERDLEPFYICW